MLRDLSEVHQPLGALGAWSSASLSPEQITFFHENGYLAGDRILTEDQVEILRAELARLMDPAHRGHDLFYEFHTNESGNSGTVLFHDVLWHPAFVNRAAQLLGAGVRFWHDQLFSKPAHHGGVVAWHQDYSYWTRTQPMQHLTCWIALDDSTQANGCLWYVPGSHRWDLLPITGLTGDMDEIRTVLTDEQRAAFRPVPVELKKGECSFHHPLMVHGSYENRSDRPRRATVINVFRDGVRSASDAELLAGVPPIPAGQPMDGRFFPLLQKR